MHPLRNGSQATIRPAPKPIVGTAGWFTESGDNNAPSYPGADWFNHVIAEFQNALTEAGVVFDNESDENLKKVYEIINNYTNRIGRYSSFDGAIASNSIYTQDGMGELTSLTLNVNPQPETFTFKSSLRDEKFDVIGSPATGNAGDVNYYAVAAIDGPGNYIMSCFFDGKNFGTFESYNPAIVNQWINAFIFSDNYQKIIGNTALNACGHAVENLSSASRGLIAGLNFAYKHNGLGVTSVVGYVSIGNLSDTTSDSHIVQNSCSFAAIVGNVGHSAASASGCDLAGGLNVTCVGNVFANNQFSGIWALKSPNTGTVLTNANISGNVLSGNTKYPGADQGQGELTFGDYNNKTAYQGKGWFANCNIIDVSSGTDFSLGAWVHKFVSAPSISYNYFTGVDKPSDAVQILDEGAEYASYLGNIGRSASVTGDYVYSTLYLKEKVTGRGATYNNNDGFRIDPSSPVKPEVMHDADGHWLYSCVLSPSLSDVGLIRLKYEGGFTSYAVKLTITSRDGSGAGFIEKYIALQGAQGIATSVLANVDVHQFGNSIGISINTANTNHTDIILQAHNSDYAVKLEVVAPTSDRNHLIMFY